MFLWINYGLSTVPTTRVQPETMIHSSGAHETSANPISLKQISYFRSPRAYLEKIQDLKDEVYKHSALAAMRRWDAAKQPFPIPEVLDPQVLHTPMDLDRSFSSQHVRQFICEIDAFGESDAHSKEVRAYRNIILAVYSNIKRMQKSGFIHDQISLLVLGCSRPSVANLIPLSIEDIQKLTEKFNNAVLLIDEGYSRGILVDLAKSCYRIFQSLQLSNSSEMNFSHSWTVTMIDECSRYICKTVRLLDVAVLVHVSAHFVDTPGLMHMHLISRGYYNYQFVPGILVQPRRLNCLSSPLGNSRALVFALQNDSSDDELYVSTTADVLADNWGPM